MVLPIAELIRESERGRDGWWPVGDQEMGRWVGEILDHLSKHGPKRHRILKAI